LLLYPQCFDAKGNHIKGCDLPLRSMGKTIIRDGYLGERCLNYFVHKCSPTAKGTNLVVSNTTTQLRIDHYNVRSTMKRTYSAPSWRRGPSSLNHVKPISEGIFQHYEKNSVIQRWIPAVRDSIRKLKPIPQYFDYRLEDRENKWAVIIESKTKCNPVLIETGQQKMCPRDFPLVATTKVASFQWCEDEKRVKKVQCSGFPTLPCCDYNKILLVIDQEQLFLKEFSTIPAA